MHENVLILKNISKSFGRRKIIDNINLEVKSGEIYGFLGPNGAGKTTTIKMILGLLSIDEGNITINSYDIKKDFEKAMDYIGGIVENPDLYGYLSGLDNLKLYARLRGVDRKRIDELVEIVGLKERINDKVSKYSLGMKQRLGLALTLLHSPKILILDEPTNGLDPAGIRVLRDILKKLAHEQNIAIFVSSHLLSEMELMCDKIAVIDKGKIIKLENMKNVIENSQDEIVKYTVKVNNVDKAQSVLKDNYGIDNVKLIENAQIEILVSNSKIASIAQILVSNDIDIYEIKKHNQSLEDAFLNMTNGGKS